MITRLLSLSGLYLGEESDMWPASSDNPEGFWENKHLMRLNEIILMLYGGRWDVAPDFPEDWVQARVLDPLKTEASQILAALEQRQPWGWKDPRNSVTLPFWKTLLPALRVVWCVRHPAEVAQSLLRRNNLPLAAGLQLWYRFNLDLLRALGDTPFMVTHYDSFFARPEEELRRALAFVALAPDQEQITDALEAISESLRHHRVAGAMEGIELPNHVELLYQALCDQAQTHVEGDRWRIIERAHASCVDPGMPAPTAPLVPPEGTELARCLANRNQWLERNLEAIQNRIRELAQSNEKITESNQWLTRNRESLESRVRELEQWNQKLTEGNQWLTQNRESLESRVSAQEKWNQSLHRQIGSGEVTLPDGSEAYLLIPHLEKAVRAKGQPDQVAIWEATIDGARAHAIYLQPPAEVTFELPSGARGKFTTAVAVHPDAWDKPNAGGCEFHLRVDGRLVWVIALDPAHRPDDRHWHELSLDLPENDDGPHQVTLETRSVGDSNECRWALWREPIFIAHSAHAMKAPEQINPGNTDAQALREQAKPTRPMVEASTLPVQLPARDAATPIQRLSKQLQSLEGLLGGYQTRSEAWQALGVEHLLQQLVVGDFKQAVEIFPAFVPQLAGADGLPVPPPELTMGYGAGNLDHYLACGRRSYESLTQLLRQQQVELGSGDALLDWGGAAGRVVRNFIAEARRGCQVWGCDVHAPSIQWAQNHLSPPFRFFNSSALPQLPFPDRHFKFVYGLSVVTHLIALRDLWLLELRRVLRPDGCLILTVHNESTWQWFREHGMPPWMPPELRELPELPGEVVEIRGSRWEYCYTFFHSDYLRRIWGQYFEIKEIVPCAEGYQTAIVMRPRAG